MATDALDPTKPTGANQVELSSELRGIKARLVIDKANIEDLQVDVAPLTTAGIKGLQILADANSNDVLSDLDFTEVGKQVVQDFADLGALKSFLGIAGAATEIVSATSTKGTITFPGGLKIKWTVDTCPGGGSSHPVSWDTPFTTVCYGGWTCKVDDGDQAAWMHEMPTLTGAKIDHNNSGSKLMITFGFGF